MGGVRTMQSLERALHILDSLGDRQVGVSEIAREQGLSKSTAFRLVSTLRRAGYLVQDPKTGRYSLGLRLLQHGQTVAAQLDIRRVAHPTMVTLAQRARGTIFLAILSGSEVFNVERIESPDPVRIAFDVGLLARYPHTVATGKVLLAALPDDERERVIAGLELAALTPNSIIDRDPLRLEIARVRRQGYAINHQEQIIGISGVAAPIYDRDGRVIAALAIAGPSARFTRESLPILIPWVQAAAGEVSSNLGAPESIGVTAG